MALDDFVEPEVGLAVAATALALSPTVRGYVRRGLVVGLAGVMRAADTVGGAARNVAGEAQNAMASTVAEAQNTVSSTVSEARATANQPRSRGSRSTSNEK